MTRKASRLSLLGKQLVQVLIAVDQLGNTLLGVALLTLPGRRRIYWADETISAHAWRRRGSPVWAVARFLIDRLFFWEPNHCQSAYESELRRAQIDSEYRATHSQD